MRKTKIIGTIGPVSDTEQIVTRLCQAGMTAVRLNLSHGDHAGHKAKIDLVRRVAGKLGLPISILLDTKGPEYRIGTFAHGPVMLRAGDRFTFTTEAVAGDETRVSVNYPHLIRDLSIGDTVLVCNGLVSCCVTELRETEAICTVEIGGELSDRKSMSFPNKVLSGPYLSDKDKADLLFAIDNDVDFLAASFVSSPEDLQELLDFLKANGGGHIRVYAKIENRLGVNNAEKIAALCDGILIARGDLGTEIPYVELPAIQKRLCAMAQRMGKGVILATEMMESMIHNPRPTRAEISDIANAVHDGCSALLLTGETAAGKYPVDAVQVMARILELTEQDVAENSRFLSREYRMEGLLDAVAHAACAMAVDVKARAMVVSSVSGRTASRVSRYRCPVDIIGLTTDERAWRALTLSWGVTPVLTEKVADMETMFCNARKAAKAVLGLAAGDPIVLTAGPINGESGNTNTIKVETIL